MSETIGFDGLTAAAIAHHLHVRGLPANLVATLMMEAAGETRQRGRHGVTVKITGWTSMGEAIIRGGDSGVMTMKIDMAARQGAPRVTAVGTLSRSGEALSFHMQELGLADKARFARRRGGPVRLELRQFLPDTLLNGATALVGRPLSDLVGHEALSRPEASGVVISGVNEAASRSRTRVDLAVGGREGLDFEIETPEVRVTIGGRNSRSLP